MGDTETIIFRMDAALKRRCEAIYEVQGSKFRKRVSRLFGALKEQNICYCDICKISQIEIFSKYRKKRYSVMEILLLFPNQIGTILRERRKTIGLTQVELAQRLGLAQSRVSYLESHPEAISAGQLLSWIRLLGLELNCAARREAPKHQEEELAW